MRGETAEIQGITEGRKMAYAQEFRDMLRKNPGIIRAAIGLTEKAEEEYNPENFTMGDVELQWDKDKGSWQIVREDGKQLRKPEPLVYGRNAPMRPGEKITDEKSGLEVTLLGKPDRIIYLRYLNRKDKASYFRMNFKDESYFVKKASLTNNPGFTEFKNTHAAAEKLKHLDFVKVVECQLGYQDNKGSWYVSKWEDLEAAGYDSVANMETVDFNDYGDPIDIDFENQPGHEQLQDQIDEISEILGEDNLNIDLHANLFYNPQTKHFVLLDVSNNDPDQMLGSPFR
jgi:hypothetical protein